MVKRTKGGQQFTLAERHAASPIISSVFFVLLRTFLRSWFVASSSGSHTARGCALLLLLLQLGAAAPGWLSLLLACVGTCVSSLALLPLPHTHT